MIIKSSKLCSVCKQSGKYYLRNRGRGRTDIDSICKPCRIRLSNEWRRKNPEKYKQQRLRSTRNHFLKKLYGLTLCEWEKLFKKQNKQCAICNSKINFSKKRAWATDHDHKTKKIRGILCYRCNYGLGFFNDSVHLLQLAIKYLQRRPCILKRK
jgi:hypothetical protein